MTRDDVTGTVVEIICDQMACDAEEVATDHELFKDLYADDFDINQIAGACEMEYELPAGTIPRDRHTKVSGLVDTICKQKGITD